MHLFKILYHTTANWPEFAEMSCNVVAHDAEQAIKKAIKEAKSDGTKRVVIRSCELVAVVDLQ